MSQRKYALELVFKSGLGRARPLETPLELNKKLTSVHYDECIQHDNTNSDHLLKEPESYQRLVKSLIYLTMIKSDLAFAVQVLNQYIHYPKKSYMEAAIRVVRYIKHAPGLGLLMPADETSQLLAYCDSDLGSLFANKKINHRVYGEV